MHDRYVQNEYMALKACRHGTFLYNINDSFVGRSLDLYGEWSESELQTLAQLLKPGYVVLDVGANIGTHTVFFAKTVGDQGVVYAFEPQRLAFQNLCANVALNALRRVVTRQVAVGAEASVVHLQVADPRLELNFAALPLNGQTQGERVEVIAIDCLALARCDLIKVDVEGMETQVLQGAQQTIARCHPVLFLENNTVERARQINLAVEALEYDAFWHISAYYAPNNFFKNPENVFARIRPEANLLCFPKSAQANVVGAERVVDADDNWLKAMERMQRRR